MDSKQAPNARRSANTSASGTKGTLPREMPLLRRATGDRMRTTTYRVQAGPTGTFRPGTGKWCAICEEWEDNRLLDTSIVSTHETRWKAVIACEEQREGQRQAEEVGLVIQAINSIE